MTYDYKDPVQIVTGKPPNYDKISEIFELSGQEIFAWGPNTIYSHTKDIPMWLIEHEKVHFKQQGDDPESWWEEYLEDEEFRLQQEIPAHKIEYKTFCKQEKDRNKQFQKRLELAKRLSSKMYGNMVNMNDAMSFFK